MDLEYHELARNGLGNLLTECRDHRGSNRPDEELALHFRVDNPWNSTEYWQPPAASEKLSCPSSIPTYNRANSAPNLRMRGHQMPDWSQDQAASLGKWEDRRLRRHHLGSDPSLADYDELTPGDNRAFMAAFLHSAAYSPTHAQYYPPAAAESASRTSGPVLGPGGQCQDESDLPLSPATGAAASLSEIETASDEQVVQAILASLHHNSASSGPCHVESCLSGSGCSTSAGSPFCGVGTPDGPPHTVSAAGVRPPPPWGLGGGGQSRVNDGKALCSAPQLAYEHLVMMDPPVASLQSSTSAPRHVSPAGTATGSGATSSTPEVLARWPDPGPLQSADQWNIASVVLGFMAGDRMDVDSVQVGSLPPEGPEYQCTQASLEMALLADELLCQSDEEEVVPPDVQPQDLTPMLSSTHGACAPTGLVAQRSDDVAQDQQWDGSPGGIRPPPEMALADDSVQEFPMRVRYQRSFGQKQAKGGTWTFSHMGGRWQDVNYNGGEKLCFQCGTRPNRTCTSRMEVSPHTDATTGKLDYIDFRHVNPDHPCREARERWIRACKPELARAQLAPPDGCMEAPVYCIGPHQYRAYIPN